MVGMGWDGCESNEAASNKGLNVRDGFLGTAAIDVLNRGKPELNVLWEHYNGSNNSLEL